jgi:hypothetical protein
MPIVQILIGNCEIMDVLLDVVWNKYYFWTFAKEIGLEETSINIIHGKNGRSQKGTTSRVHTKFQNWFNKVYIQNLSYSVLDRRYSKGLFNAFKKTMVEAS